MKTTGRGRCGWRSRPGRITGVVLTAAAIAATGLPGPARAQEAEAPCPAERQEGWIGISGLTCSRCVIQRLGATETEWSFATEPEITRVDSGSPAAGSLRAGDLLVGIDGHLITSREGGRRFGRVRPGERVSIRFRRDGQVRSTTLTATGRCRPGRLPETPGAPPLPEVDNVLDRLPRPPQQPGRAPTPERPSLEAPPAPRLPSPGAYLGLGFRCSDCRARTRGDRVFWFFSEPPEVLSVEPGGPADRAGLRAGDRIQSVDGVAIDTPEGGEAFGRMVPGQVVLLTVSRADGSRANVPLTPEEPQAGSRAPAALPSPADVVRYEGVVGPARVTVTGGPVSVVSEEGSGLVVIRTSENEIRIRVPPQEGGGSP